MAKTYECKVTCLLHKTCRSPFMKLAGDLDANILVIGEGPGEVEDKYGTPFIGDSGKLLRYAMSEAKLDKYAIVNSVRCRPPHNRDPRAPEWRSCQEHLYRDIESMPNLRMLILFGNFAMLSILGFQGIKKHSGKLLEWTHKDKAYLVMPILHPSGVLQNPEDLGVFINHVKRIPNALGGTLVDWETDMGVYYTVKSSEEFEGMMKRLHWGGHIAYDIETNGLDPFQPGAKIKSLAISPSYRFAYVIPMENLPHDMWLKLKDLFENPIIPKIGHSIKFDNLWMKVVAGIDVKGTYWDTQISQYLLDENESNSLKDMAWKYSKLGGYEVMVGGEPHKSEGEALFKYNAIDADLTLRIENTHVFDMSFSKFKLNKLMENLLMPVTEVLTDMEYKGILIDPQKVEECSKRVDKKVESLIKSVFLLDSVKSFESISGKPFNPNSHVQLREILFKLEGLSPMKLTPKARKPSTDLEVLGYYADKSDLCRLLVEYSTYETMRSKTINELIKYNRNNRIHTHYWLTESKPGRTSSKEPNLQNVPKSEKDVVNIRGCFLADPGYQLLEADYNQHELRCMAEEAGDEALWKAIYSGDVHRATASGILKKDPSLITDDERRNIGKTFNFGFIYGLTRYGIVKRLKCTPQEADRYLSEFFNVYSKTKAWMDKTTEFVRKNGYVTSRTGRVRRFPIWDELDDTSVRQAINAPIQSLAGDILLYSLIGIYDFLRGRKSFLTLEIHDSLIMNIHNSELSIIPSIKEIMLNYFRTWVPFKGKLDVDMKIGPSWDKLEKI